MKDCVKNRGDCLRPNENLKIEIVDNSNVSVFKYNDPPKIKHVTSLLEGVVMPKSEVNPYTVRNQDKK